MAVERRADWGRPGTPPADLPWFADDASAAGWIAARRDDRAPAIEVGLCGGDMVATLGRGTTAVCYQLDVLQVLIETPTGTYTTVAVSHVVERRPRRSIIGCLSANVVARAPALRYVMNAEFVGPLDVAPRGHPNDGRFEIVDFAATMPARQRRQAVARMGRGDHLPHPDISVGRETEATWKPRGIVHIDGRPVPEVVSISIRIVPDAIVAWVR